MATRKELELARLEKLTLLEQEYWARGELVGGMDEAGRGPLAGPVAAACVVMPAQPLVEGVNDSKKVSEKKRLLVYQKIIETAVSYQVVLVDAQRIDEINILAATKEAFCQAYEGLSLRPGEVLVDAVKDLAINARQRPLIHGDALSYSIAAASILAKVTRDRLMVEYDALYPEYGFAKHKGYGTREHIEALKKYGPCPLHRRTFIKNFL
jgi:ribonuclease HII